MADEIVITDQLNIPLEELQFRFTTGSGPGGQHVNKAATRVILSFDIAHSPSLDEAARTQLLTNLATRLDRQGIVHISVHESRSQFQNRQTAIARLQTLLREALVEAPERRPTRPSRTVREERLTDKRRRSAIKRERHRRWSTIE